MVFNLCKIRPETSLNKSNSNSSSLLSIEVCGIFLEVSSGPLLEPESGLEFAYIISEFINLEIFFYTAISK